MSSTQLRGNHLQFMRATSTRKIQLLQDACSPAQRRKGEERAATSKTRRRRSDTSGTRFVVLSHGSVKASARSVASPTTRRTLFAARSSRATHPGAFGPSCCPSRRSHCADLRCACRAASSAPANSMALGAPHRRRRCFRPFLRTICYLHER